MVRPWFATSISKQFESEAIQTRIEGLATNTLGFSMKLSMKIDPVNDSVVRKLPPTSGCFEHLTVLSTSSSRVVWTVGGDSAANVG